MNWKFRSLWKKGKWKKNFLNLYLCDANIFITYRNLQVWRNIQLVVDQTFHAFTGFFWSAIRKYSYSKVFDTSTQKYHLPWNTIFFLGRYKYVSSYIFPPFPDICISKLLKTFDLKKKLKHNLTYVKNVRPFQMKTFKISQVYLAYGQIRSQLKD